MIEHSHDLLERRERRGGSIPAIPGSCAEANIVKAKTIRDVCRNMAIDCTVKCVDGRRSRADHILLKLPIIVTTDGIHDVRIGCAVWDAIQTTHKLPSIAHSANTCQAWTSAFDGLHKHVESQMTGGFSDRATQRFHLACVVVCLAKYVGKIVVPGLGGQVYLLPHRQTDLRQYPALRAQCSTSYS